MLILLVVTLLTAVAPARGEPSPLNFLFIISDDQRWDSIGAAGNPHVITPNLDRLARQGAYFRQATISTPQCSPARASLLTGVYTHTHGKYSNQYWRVETQTPEGFAFPMLPVLLRDAGYRTVLVGKWHLINEPWNCGFAEVRTWMPGGAGPKKDPRLSRGNTRANTRVEGYTTEIFADSTIEFLKSDAAKTKPFFIWHSDTHPHTPLQPVPQRIADLYGDKTTEELLPPGFDRDIEAANFRAYYECCTHLDEQVGRLLEALDETGLAANTVVVYLGDNGFMMGSRGVGARGGRGKVVPYEESVRVPLIIRAPGYGVMPVVSDAPVSSLDLPPTFAAMAGAAIPEQWHGRDLTLLLKRGHDNAISEAFVQFADTKSEEFGDKAYRMVRTPTHKLIRWIDPSKPPELYDLVNDPRETQNLFEDESASRIRSDMHERLLEWGRRTNDPALTDAQ